MKKVMFLLAITFVSAVSFAQVKDSVNQPCPPCPQIQLPTSEEARPIPFFTPAPPKDKGVTTRPNNYSSTISGSFNTTTNNYYYGKMPGERNCCDVCGGNHHGHPHPYEGWIPGFWFWLLLAVGLGLWFWDKRNPIFPPKSDPTPIKVIMPTPATPVSKVEYPAPVKPAVDLAGMNEEFKSTGATVEVKPDGGVIVTIPKSEPLSSEKGPK